MRDADRARRQDGRRWAMGVALNVSGLFGMFRRRAGAPATRTVDVVMPAQPPPPPPPVDPVDHGSPLHHDVVFKALHEDLNPSGSVRVGEMTCPSCDRQFRYFRNSSGSKTLCACPGCGRQYRV